MPSDRNIRKQVTSPGEDKLKGKLDNVISISTSNETYMLVFFSEYHGRS